MAVGPAARRRRADDIAAATRALWDERGMTEAPVEDIARVVGINRALVYRHFGSKEELELRTATLYLADLRERLLAAVDGADAGPEARMRALCEAFADFALAFPAFLDCALSILRRPWTELRETVDDGVWIAVARATASALAVSSSVLREGAEAGVFTVDDPDRVANHLYAQGLGVLQAARLGVGVREVEPGVPVPFAIADDDVRRWVADAALAVVRAR